MESTLQHITDIVTDIAGRDQLGVLIGSKNSTGVKEQQCACWASPWVSGERTRTEPRGVPRQSSTGGFGANQAARR